MSDFLVRFARNLAEEFEKLEAEYDRKVEKSEAFRPEDLTVEVFQAGFVDRSVRVRHNPTGASVTVSSSTKSQLQLKALAINTLRKVVV